MIQGLYLSANGIVTNSYREDVIANNIANSETVGFKRDLALVRQRATAAQEYPSMADVGDPVLGQYDGGMLSMPTYVDSSPGEAEATGNPLDVALQGKGFFAVKAGGTIRLTRNGQFMVDREGNLVTSNGTGNLVLDAKQTAIHVDSSLPVAIDRDGTISQDGKAVARLGVFTIGEPRQLVAQGGTLLAFPEGEALLPGSAEMRSGMLERSNVDSTSELTALMDVQRQLEANANMIQIQDGTLDKLINDAGKIS